jgi:hypothetical protein
LLPCALPLLLPGCVEGVGIRVVCEVFASEEIPGVGDVVVTVPVLVPAVLLLVVAVHELPPEPTQPAAAGVAVVVPVVEEAAAGATRAVVPLVVDCAMALPDRAMATAAAR